MAKAASKSVFISHAAVDKDIAEKVVDLLATGMGIDVEKQVFCSSLEGIKVPAGLDFVQFIQDQIQEPKLVVLLVSQNYLASQFCLAELGATWAMSHRVIPILIPPVSYADMKAVLVNKAALKIDDPSDWNEALGVFRPVLGIDPNVNRWERKRDEFLKSLAPLIKKQSPAPIVPLAKAQEIEAKLRDANEEISELEAKVEHQAKVISELKKLKDAKEVAEVELDSLPESEQLEKLTEAAKKALDKLPGIVGKALFYRCRGEDMQWPGFVGDPEVGEIKEAIESDFLRDVEDRGIDVNEGNPKVSRAIAALNALRSFVESDHDEFSSAYADEYDHELKFESKQFWNYWLH